MVIKVNGYKWRIVYTSNSEELKRSDGVITLGVTDIPLRTVFIHSGLSGYMRAKVLIHELSHVWMFSYGIYLSIQEEEFVCSFVDMYGRSIIESADMILSQYVRATI